MKKSIGTGRGSVLNIVMKALQTGDKYGYEICKEIESKTAGTYTLLQPSLYSALKRLEANKLISSYWVDSDIGGRRHYYSLTAEGLKKVESSNFSWEDQRTEIIGTVFEKSEVDKKLASVKLELNQIEQNLENDKNSAVIENIINGDIKSNEQNEKPSENASQKERNSLFAHPVSPLQQDLFSFGISVPEKEIVVESSIFENEKQKEILTNNSTEKSSENELEILEKSKESELESDLINNNSNDNSNENGTQNNAINNIENSNEKENQNQKISLSNNNDNSSEKETENTAINNNIDNSNESEKSPANDYSNDKSLVIKENNEDIASERSNSTLENLKENNAKSLENIDVKTLENTENKEKVFTARQFEEISALKQVENYQEKKYEEKKESIQIQKEVLEDRGNDLYNSKLVEKLKEIEIKDDTVDKSETDVLKIILENRKSKESPTITEISTAKSKISVSSLIEAKKKNSFYENVKNQKSADIFTKNDLEKSQTFYGNFELNENIEKSNDNKELDEEFEAQFKAFKAKFENQEKILQQEKDVEKEKNSDILEKEKFAANMLTGGINFDKEELKDIEKTLENSAKIEKENSINDLSVLKKDKDGIISSLSRENDEEVIDLKNAETSEKNASDNIDLESIFGDLISEDDKEKNIDENLANSTENSEKYIAGVGEGNMPKTTILDNVNLSLKPIESTIEKEQQEQWLKDIKNSETDNSGLESNVETEKRYSHISQNKENIAFDQKYAMQSVDIDNYPVRYYKKIDLNNKVTRYLLVNKLDYIATILTCILMLGLICASYLIVNNINKVELLQSYFYIGAITVSILILIYSATKYATNKFRRIALTQYSSGFVNTLFLVIILVVLTYAINMFYGLNLTNIYKYAGSFIAYIIIAICFLIKPLISLALVRNEKFYK